MGAKEQSGRTWPSIFWARGTPPGWCGDEKIANLFLQCNRSAAPVVPPIPIVIRNSVIRNSAISNFVRKNAL